MKADERFLAELLGSARELDQPPHDAAGRVALAIVNGDHRRRRASTSSRSWGPWLVFLAMTAVAVGLVGSALVVRRGSEIPASVTAPPAPAVEASELAVVVSPPALSMEAPPPCLSTARAIPSAAPPRAKPSSTGPVVRPPPPQEDEMALIDRARAAVRSGDAAGAQAALARHASVFASHARFTEEARALGVEARALGGDHATAEAEARRFLEAFPRSAYARRVRTAAGVDD